MNIKYIFVLCFTIKPLVIQCVLPAVVEEAIENSFEVALEYSGLTPGSNLTTDQLSKYLGYENALRASNYFKKKRIPLAAICTINKDLFQEIMKYIYNQRGQPVIDESFDVALRKFGLEPGSTLTTDQFVEFLGYERAARASNYFKERRTSLTSIFQINKGLFEEVMRYLY